MAKASKGGEWEMDVFEKVKAIVADQLSIDPSVITMETKFEDLNADSLDVVEVIMALENEFDIEIPDEEAEKIKNIGSVVDYVQANV